MALTRSGGCLSVPTGLHGSQDASAGHALARLSRSRATRRSVSRTGREPGPEHVPADRDAPVPGLRRRLLPSARAPRVATASTATTPAGTTRPRAPTAAGAGVSPPRTWRPPSSTTSSAPCPDRTSSSTHSASGKPAPDAPPVPTPKGDTGWLFVANRGGGGNRTRVLRFLTGPSPSAADRELSGAPLQPAATAPRIRRDVPGGRSERLPGEPYVMTPVHQPVGLRLGGRRY
jgi:hypothetical protein